MAEKTIKTRIGLKIDTLANWNSSTLVLKKGEVAFATTAASTGTGLSEPVTICKIGDGSKTFFQLPDAFYAKASDVLAACKSEAALASFINSHLSAGEGITLSFANNTVTITHSTPTGASAGAKGSTAARTYLKTITTDKFGHITAVTTGAETVVDTNQTITVSGKNATFGDNTAVDFRAGSNIELSVGSDDAITIIGKDWSNEIAKVETAVTSLENGQVKTNKTNIEELQNQIGGLTGAMHFVGVSTTNPTASEATVSGHDTWAIGDVVLYGKKEYVLTKPGNTSINWAELGDEGSYAVKGSITNADIATDAAIDQSKIDGLTDALNGKVSKETGKSLISDTLITKLEGIDTGAQVNKIETVKVGGTSLTITDKAVNIPAATNTTLGAVKVDNTTIKSTDGTIAIKEVSTDLFVQGTDTLIFDCGGAN